MNRFKCNISQLKPIPFALAALLGSGAALAQSPPQTTLTAPDVAAENPTLQLETVIVKAQRRAERLQDVPVSVKAFSAKQIEDTGIKSTQDFINLTPNMSFDNSQSYANSYVAIRGVTQINNADSPVAVIVDGVPQNSQKQLKMSLFDIQSIEVLKGPQGALYGRNAIGGAINIETKQPKNQFEGFGAIEAGNGGAITVSGGASGALVDDVALFRIVGQTKKSNGLIENTFRGNKVDAIDHDNSVRAKLTVRPSADIQLDFRAGLTDFKAGANWDSIVNPIHTERTPNDITSPRSNLLGKSDGKTKDFSFKAEVETGIGVLTAITAYTDLSESYRGDIDFSNAIDMPGGFLGFGIQAGQGQDLSVKMLSQEVRITSPSKQPLRWIAGAYYLDTKRDLQTKAFIDVNGELSQFDDPNKTLINLREANQNKAYAGFGQVDVDLRDNFTLSGALRYDKDRRNQTDVATGLHRIRTFDAWQPKVTLTRRFSPNLLSYLTYSTGFRSGGFNAPGLNDFKAENLKNYEAGTKMTLLDGRLILNGAAFYSRSSDFQFFYVDAVSASQVIANIDRVDIKGVDIDFRYLPFKGLQLDGGLGITNSTIEQNAVDPSTIGNHTPKTVPFKANLGIQYVWPVAPQVNASARLDIEHRGKKYWHPDNAAVSNPVDLINVRLGLSEAKGKWSLSLFARNLTDKKYYADYNSAKYTGLSYGAGLPLDIGSLAPPRSFGLDAQIRF